MTSRAKKPAKRPAAKKKPARRKVAKMEEPTITAIKGFNADWTCRGFKYELGKTYEHAGDVAACESGFHACEYPLDVFGYYAPAGSKFAEVKLGGKTARESGGDSKIAAAKITIGAELSIGELVKRAFDYVWSRCTIEDGGHATGNQGAASATGNQGAASATGYQGAASATGYRGAASATGNRGAASATGYQGAAMASGYEGRAKGADGNALFLAERDNDLNITAVWAGIVGRDGVKADTFYTLKDGRPVEVTT